MKKLHLDALVIQQGRLAEKEKNMSKEELMSAIRYGADDVFKDDGGEDEEIDAGEDQEIDASELSKTVTDRLLGICPVSPVPCFRVQYAHRDTLNEHTG